jgi:hypothetical protein
MLRLEQLSYYQHLSLTGAPERPILAYRIVDIRGSRFHVLTRLQDAGLDFTGRTNFTAHHLAFAPEEIRQLPAPAIILRDWSGWLGSWTKEPQLLSNENWGNLNSLAGISAVPAHTWQRLTGDAANGYGLLEAKAGTLINADGIDDKETLSLLAESTELMEVRETRRDYKAAAWQYTFTTSMQEQDNPADFRWRFVHSDSPAFAKLAGAECRPLCSVRPSRWTDEEASLARAGRRKPNFLAEPEDGRTVEGQSITFQAKADGIPYPDYEWYEVDRAGNAKGLVAQGPELAIPSPVLGLTRYVVRASNSAGEAISRVALLSVEGKVRLQRDRPSTPLPASRSRGGHIRSAEDIDKQRSKLEVQKAEEMFRRKQRRKVMFGLVLAVIGVVAVSASLVVLKNRHSPKSRQAREDAGEPSSNVTIISSDSADTNRNLAVGTLQKEPEAQKANSGPTEPVSAGNRTSGPTVLPSADFAPPLPWASKVVGKLGANAEAVANGTSFTLTGGGQRFDQQADSFFFLRQTVSNSVQLSARLLDVQRGSLQSLCGLMMRESDDAQAPFVFIGASRAMVFCIHRDMKGEPCKTPFRYQVEKAQPIRFRISRGTNSITTEFALERGPWKSVEHPSTRIPTDTFLLGFAVCSGYTDATVTAHFDEVQTNSLSRTGP